jgi:Reverse transcriptase (RNA-dependent DNA polymerase)
MAAVAQGSVGAQQPMFDLNEDWLTAWVPDVGAHVDAKHFIDGDSPGRGPLVEWLRVPRPSAPPMTVPVLHPGWHVGLHATTAALRDAIDSALSSNVFGYRRGADRSARYADEWQRFTARVEECASNADAVVFADVHQFFASTTWATVIRALEQLVSGSQQPLRRLATEWSRKGLRHLPAGYGSARMLANAVLAHVDRRLSISFARWVDDYRLFLPTGYDPLQAVDTLDLALRQSGFRLNRSKTRVLLGRDAAEENKNTLASIYHPERDRPSKVRANLRRLFEVVSVDPVRKRSALRFCLSRFEKEHDDFAVEFAIDSIRRLPWEAPRLISYLASFPEREDAVSERIEAILVEAAGNGDAWLAARTAGMALRRGVSSDAARMLGDSMDGLRGTSAWGLVLRVLARSDSGHLVARALRSPPTNPRAALIVLRDLDVRLPGFLAEQEPATAVALKSSPAGIPNLRSLL